MKVLHTLIQGARVRAEQLEHGVVRLVLTRPELRNAFDSAMIAELGAALEDLAARPAPELRVLWLAGEGKAFCAGADLDYMRTQADNPPEANLEDARHLGALFRRVAAFPAPVVCAVQGAAMGGGFGLAACADLVIAEPGALFALSEVRLGILPAVISPYVLRRLGLSQAAPLMLSGRRIGAAEAQACGLVHRLVPEGSTLDEAVAAALAELLQAGPQAARRTKALILKQAPLPSPELAELTAQAIAETRGSAEAKAGLEAFLQKFIAPWVVTP